MTRLAPLLLLFSTLLWHTAPAQTAGRVELVLDTSEADQALAILRNYAAHRPVSDEQWTKLFETKPYQSLKAREEAMQRGFTDAQFKTFLLSPQALAKAPEWRNALAVMRQTDLQALGARVLDWLPSHAVIRAQVFPEIKPKTNSFVWSKAGEGPAIFLYLEHQTSAQFENTVAHECHHIGLRSLEAEQKRKLSALPANVRRTIEWMGAFGEGEAMLAAVGSTERHPHWEDDAVARARWDADLMHFSVDVSALEALFRDILEGKLTDDAAIRTRAAPFWGQQGAWYTVGYEMAVLVAAQDGRDAFRESLGDPRKLLIRYNQIATKANADGATLATWSPELLSRLEATP